MRTPFLAALAVVLVAAGLIATRAPSAQAAPSTGRSLGHARMGGGPAMSLAAVRAETLALIDAERSRAGAGPLHLDATLDAVAQARSEDMVARHYFSHHIPGAGMVFDILDHRGVRYEMAGENLALNNYILFYPLDRTVRQTNADLMNSPEHRANLLEPRYAELGLGAALDAGSGKLILTEVFVQP